MSDAPLTDRDRQILAELERQIDDAETPADYERVSRRLHDAVREHKATLRAHEQRLDHLGYRLDQLESGGTPAEDDAPPLVHYANIPEAEREDLLGTSDQIAVAIHTNWEAVAWTLGDSQNRKIGVDTKTKANAKHNPSKLKHRLKSVMDRDVRSTEVYRGLKALAKLSGGTEHTKANGSRVEIIGGDYRYEERPTTDNKSIRRVLWRVDQ